MKKIAWFIMLLAFAANASSQRIQQPKKQLSPQEYRQKRDEYVVLGSIFLVGGTALAFVGANVQRNSTGFDFSGIFIEALGIDAAGGSVPFFIGAIYNHRKAKMISANVKLENSYAPRFLTASRYSFPAISVKINWCSLPLARRIHRANRDLGI